MSARRVLVAARGEIAVRIIRALRDMGITSVAVYSKEDASAMHVRLADYRVCIGEGSGRHSYMNISNIITAALNFGCDAIHPGYGFLSENADFAEACRKSGLIFIGPEPETMRRMGNKQEARSMMKAAGVPVVPGSDAPLYDVREAKKAA
ncbi:MAG: biotin carboxylase N-terminal domain-containing protein, partial [Erysipelotrichaceae bacterium]|nr:biotin carboxylase N-terminal domain-containing protein [Erysipelotrichaceae bacterium]